MALLESKLESGLLTMSPTTTPGLAEQRFVDAVSEYMKGAAAGAVPIVAAAVDTQAKPAMLAALTFAPGSPEDAALSLQGGLTAFWGAVVAAPAVFFPGAVLVTPPTFAGLEGALTATFEDGGNRTLSAAAAALAGDIHGETTGLGTATFPGPVVSPIS